MGQPAAGDAANARLRIRQPDSQDRGDAADLFAQDVRAGLLAAPKRLFPKYFYDELGSLLFDAICLLPEYYLTRAENEILNQRADEIVAAAGDAPLTLLELGSGSAVKTRSIIEALLKRQDELLYVPIDISASALEASARALLQSYPALTIEAYASDYESALARVRRETIDENRRVLALFLGSNIGNFAPAEAHDFLRALRREALHAGDALLVGADLKKEKHVLEAAYDDPVGVTAAFNLNLLARLNRELDADFNPRAFRHVAFYNEAQGRVEIYLESTRAQQVSLRKLDLQVGFAAGERIHTENSHKYDIPELSALAAATGFRLAHTWLDRERRFSSNLLIAERDKQ
ncbi:MAG TPA: L-histidine N(alpha)-methyltransferase [Pyrinomonadaceae bacterium]|jgi:dimethylhistidine N-methyltransferase|nr:L-histidine N(alpha)-methyltransferase [Pyrinomonadaceae bacterium]